MKGNLLVCPFGEDILSFGVVEERYFGVNLEILKGGGMLGEAQRFGGPSAFC